MQLGSMNNPTADLFTEIRRVKESGFDYLDLTLEAPRAALESTDWQSVRAAINDAGLGVVCHCAPYYPIESPSPAVRQASLDELRRSIDAAQIVGADLCTMHFRQWQSWLGEEGGYQLYTQLGAILVRHGAERGVAVAMENSPKNEHQLKHFRTIYSRVPGLRLLLDIGHVNVQTRRSLTRDYLFALSENLAHVHISDNDGSADQHLPFGAPKSGGINLLQELRDLRSFRYDGRITLEIFGNPRWLNVCAEQVRELWDQAT